jgi:prepilin-type N-terminal cleavage/methylation domain-containing protein
MLQNTKQRKEGFTIIEVLIVLAIAGLIMLIVFLAVPALQRNSRNTQQKNAAAAILATANEYQDINNGALPGDITIGTDGTISATGAGTTATGKTQAGYTADLSTTATTTVGDFRLATNRKCNGNTLATAATPRAMAVQYVVETGTGTATQCTES